VFGLQAGQEAVELGGQLAGQRLYVVVEGELFGKRHCVVVAGG
jgi:hypothetical protein